jgi:hypothetical protein
MLREGDLLGPLERLSVLSVCGDEGVDLVANLPRCGEAGAAQAFAGEDREPDHYLVQPGGMGRGEVKMDIGVLGQPAIVFGLVSAEIAIVDGLRQYEIPRRPPPPPREMGFPMEYHCVPSQN